MSRLAPACLAMLLTAAPAASRDLVEYYHAGLDHYFLTGEAREIRDLDSGALRGWTRTGQVVAVFDAGDPRLAGSIPVCRFYGNPAAGLDSHFYSATPQECEEVRQRWPDAWLLESADFFRVHPLDAGGQCPAGTRRVHRLFNQRSDVNHRYTVDDAIVAAMVARGYTVEGVGSPLPAVFCAADTAPASPATATPTCSLSASSATLNTGASLTLTASCTQGPTGYLWTNCNGTSATCTTTETTPGMRTYYVNGRNAAGVGPSASVVITWQQPASAPPVCTLSANPSQPYTSGSTTLTASCTQSPTSFAWTGCASNGSTCVATRASAGQSAYSVVASNAFGSSPPASLTLNWIDPPASGPDLCGTFSDVKRVDLSWGGFLNTNDPGDGFKAAGVLVGRFVVPLGASGTSIPGVVSAVEYVDGPAERILTLSPSACDFRGFVPNVFPTSDPTGATKPLAWGFGINPSLQFALAGMGGSQPKLIPGQAYYVNVLNRSFSTGETTCGTEFCNLRITVNAPR